MGLFDALFGSKSGGQRPGDQRAGWPVLKPNPNVKMHPSERPKFNKLVALQTGREEQIEKLFSDPYERITALCVALADEEYELSAADRTLDLRTIKRKDADPDAPTQGELTAADATMSLEDIFSITMNEVDDAPVTIENIARLLRSKVQK